MSVWGEALQLGRDLLDAVRDLTAEVRKANARWPLLPPGAKPAPERPQIVSNDE